MVSTPLLLRAFLARHDHRTAGEPCKPLRRRTRPSPRSAQRHGRRVRALPAAGADAQHYFAGNVLSDAVDGAADTNRFLGPFLQAVYLLVAVTPH